jgi:pimeloyl-ACP methyl ester carboxylesterase/quercetin dioxygenase-like cupin family protein
MNEAKQLRAGFVETNGTKLYYEMMGEGHPLVLLHGGYLDRRMWDDQFAVFAQDYQVIRYDIRGFGKSALPQVPYSDRQDLFNLLTFLDVEKIYLLALSLGGEVALDFTLEYPGMVEALILVGSPVPGYPVELMFTQEQLEQQIQRWTPFRQAKNERNIPAMVDQLMNDETLVPSPNYPAARQFVRENLSEYSFVWVLDPAPKQELVPPAYERLAEIHVPALIIVGAEDHFQLHKSADKLEKDIDGARRVTISETHHMPNMEKPEEFNRIVLDFLKTLKREGVKGYVLGPGESVLGAGSSVKAGHASTGGSLTLMESHTRGGAPMHIHSREDECFYVMEGSVTVHCGDEVFEAGPKSFVFLPRGIPHSWDVNGGDVATLLIITVPGGFEDFLREHHEAGSAPDDVKDQIAAKYGIKWIRNPDRGTPSQS